MQKSKKLFLFLFFISNQFCFSFGFEDIGEIDWLKNRRKKFPLGINVSMLGITGWGNITVDYFLNSKINVETGLGIQTNGESSISYLFGSKYHILGKTPLNLTPYFGIYDAFYIHSGNIKQHNLYFPIGIQKIKRDKFSWSLELAYQYNVFMDRNIWGSFKIGYRFL